jgi:hypothetical protein
VNENSSVIILAYKLYLVDCKVAPRLSKLSSVVDLHKEWCGPCEVMEPTFRRIFLDMDSADQRLAYFSVIPPLT